MRDLILLLIVLIVPLLLVRRRARLAKLPPGPPHHLWRDHKQDLPAFQPWRTFKAWNKEYGPVISFSLGGTPVVVLGTAEAAIDLLEKRGEIYSSRPRHIMGEILTGGMRGLGMSYGPRWRRWRSLQTSALSMQASAQYKTLQTIESSLLLRDLLGNEDPMKYRSLLVRFAVSITSCVAYGRRIKTLEDEIVLAHQRSEEYVMKLQPYVPGRYIVESWPILLYLPRPLQWFRYEPERHRVVDTQFYLSLVNNVKEKMQLDTAQPSMATYAVEKQEEFGLNDAELAYALSAPWSAGVGTTISTIEVAILAVLHYPEVMRKVQAELDSVVGAGRLPMFEDQESLPYFSAFLKEIMRWKPIAPSGVPHSVTEDDVYKGMIIPKGSTVYANIYAIMSDPEMFPDPDIFLPERFLDVTDPRLVNFKFGFGFGRRICPGLHVALQSMFIMLSRILCIRCAPRVWRWRRGHPIHR